MAGWFGRTLGTRLVGRVVDSERAISLASPLALVHGDAFLRNMRTGPDGAVVLPKMRRGIQRPA